VYAFNPASQSTKTNYDGQNVHVDGNDSDRMMSIRVSDIQPYVSNNEYPTEVIKSRQSVS